MQTSAARYTLLALLLASGIAAAFFTWNIARRIDALDADRVTRDAVLERLAPAVSGIAAAQQAYVDYGLRDEASFSRVSMLLDQITTDAAGLRSSDSASGGTAHLEEFWTALSALKAADSQARERLAAGESLAAADLLFSTSRPHVMALEAGLRGFRDTEFTGYTAARGALTGRSNVIIGLVAVLWAAGLIALVRIPRPAVWAEAPRAVVEPTPVPQPTVASPTVDLAATADLAMAIARVADTADVDRLLERAARILDARGIIIWMGAGDDLFAAAATGYDPSVVSRLRPIGRAAENATAAAWRAGELRTVTGDAGTLGAVVAPMFGPGGCIGVLAAELRNNRESDPATHAATAIIASQLAMVLSAWPAASAAADATGAPEMHPGESDRQAAAS